jgi:catechol 2,3-dioxygenase-like lactoylglutathione lyase family enzyme
MKNLGSSKYGMRERGLAGSLLALMTAGAVVVCWSAENVERPKILGIAYVTFKVTKMEKALEFYGGELGLRKVAVKGAGELRQEDFILNDFQRVELVETEPGTGRSNLLEIGLATDNLEKLREYLMEKGVPAGQIQNRKDGSQYFETGDPEGNKIAFVESHGSGKPAVVPEAISHRLIHAGIVVKDADTENRFYKDVLGFHVYWHGGMKEGQTDWMAMQVPDGTDWIEYMLRVPADANKRTRGVMYHVSLGVPSVAEAAKQLEKRGYSGFEEPKIGKDGKWQLNLYDPDETRVELMEFKPVEKPCCADITGTNPEP